MPRRTPHLKKCELARLRLLAACDGRPGGMIEPLENRVLLTVALDANGWTQVTPTQDVSRLIYVSSSSGLDSNNGLSPAAPVATIAHAVTMLRANSPDWILLNRGDTFVENVVL